MCVSIWLRGIAITHPTSLSPCPGNLCKTELHSNLTPQLPTFPQCAPACSVSLFQVLLLLRAAPLRLPYVWWKLSLAQLTASVAAPGVVMSWPPDGISGSGERRAGHTMA